MIKYTILALSMVISLRAMDSAVQQAARLLGQNSISSKDQNMSQNVGSTDKKRPAEYGYQLPNKKMKIKKTD